MACGRFVLLGKVERVLKADWLTCLQGAWKAPARRSYINSFVLAHDISVCRTLAAALKEGALDWLSQFFVSFSGVIRRKFGLYHPVLARHRLQVIILV
ncbi:hypothetical protein PGIGA_G00038720 [Pangasianodon gigas]|uniref:Uncharacterized protein n=1 Tax=Pangasianodon gigas TaxID=30993 RepID=A0ACC5WZW0_PANGG|nr:hypothetical protein [Pangasianodon gigas]